MRTVTYLALHPDIEAWPSPRQHDADLIMQDWLLKRAGYKPHDVLGWKDEFYRSWDGINISDYWRRMQLPKPVEEPVPTDPHAWVHSGT